MMNQDIADLKGNLSARDLQFAQEKESLRHEFEEQRDKHMQAMLFYKNYIQELFEYHESEKQKLTFEFEQKLRKKEATIEI